MTILQESFAQLRAAQGRFQVSANALQDSMQAKNKDKEVMIPMTQTLYVAGTLVNPETVLVDIGTGYFVEKHTSDAIDYYKRKIEYLKSQLDKLQSTIVAKRSQMQIFMDIYQLKMSRLAVTASTKEGGAVTASA